MRASDGTGELVGEVSVEIRDISRENVPDPGLTLVRHDTEVPYARHRIGWGRRPEPARVVARREEDMMVQLVLLLPPIHEDKVAAAPVVDAKETDAVARRRDSRRRQNAHGRRLRGRHQLR